MIVISLVLVIAAAVSLFIGLFVATETLAFIWGAIALCLVSLFLLWLGTRQRKGAGPTSPSAPVYGGAARAGGSTTPARTSDGEDLDALTSPDGGTVVRRTTARDRAATRVASARSDADDTVVVGGSTDPAESQPHQATTGAAATVASSTSRKKAVARKVPVKKVAKRTTATRAVGGKAATKRTASKATNASTSATTGAEARARLAQIAGVGPAKQDALLDQYGSLEGIRDASVNDIVANVRGFGEALATRVKRELG